MTGSKNSPSDEPWRLSQPEIEAIRKGEITEAAANQRVADWELQRRRAWELTSNPERLNEELLKIFNRMREFVADEGSQFERATAELDRFLSQLSSTSRWKFPAESGEFLAEQSIELYRLRRPRQGPVRGLALARLAARYGNSMRVRDFLLEMLGDTDAAYRSAVVETLGARDFEDKDGAIYRRLDELRRKDTFDRPVLLAMWRLNREGALPMLLSEVPRVVDVRDFITLSKFICSYGRTDLLHLLLKRMRQLPRGKYEGPFVVPGRGFKTDLLHRFISESEDEALEAALEALEQNRPELARSANVLLSRLGSPSARSRTAILKCLRAGFDGKYFGDSEIRQILLQLKMTESDPEVIKILTEALGSLDRMLGTNGGSA